jgi:hypothetical protein
MYSAVVAEVLGNAEELVVLGDAVGAAGAAGLDLAGARGDGQVGDERVLGLAGAMADDAAVAVARASSMAWSVSVSVPIWLTLMRIALPAPELDAAAAGTPCW